MAFFKLGSDGQVTITGGKRYVGKSIVEVARSDPKYLQWARRDCTLGASVELLARIEEVMTTHGVPFTRTKKK